MKPLSKRIALLAAALSLPVLVACEDGDTAVANMTLVDLLTIGKESVPAPTLSEYEIGHDYGIYLSDLDENTCVGDYEWKLSSVHLWTTYFTAGEDEETVGTQPDQCLLVGVRCSLSSEQASLLLATAGEADNTLNQFLLSSISSETEYTSLCK